MECIFKKKTRLLRVVEKVFYIGSVSLNCTEPPGPVKSPPLDWTWCDPTDIPDSNCSKGAYKFWGPQFVNPPTTSLRGEKSRKAATKIKFF